MRILLTSATVAILSGSCSGSPNNSAVSQVTKDVEAAYTENNELLPEKQKMGPSSLARTNGDECNSYLLRNNHHRDGEQNALAAALPDIGILSCSQPNQVCIRDNTSSLGGRCNDKRPRDKSQAVGYPVFQQRRRAMKQQQQQQQHQFPFHHGQHHQRSNQTPRHLQNTNFICPTNCPKDFCKCAEKHGNGVACAKELDQVCKDDMLIECIPYEYLNYYEQTYCPFAECMATGGKYWECECEFQRDYCDLYYEYVDSDDNCEIAACCDLQEGKDKASCIPALAPTAVPSMMPSLSFMPSGAPTDSHPPTTSSAPTVSSPPSASPTISSAPTLSSNPTATASERPSGMPSDAPSTKPTSSPSQSPSHSSQPSAAPTGMPSASPSSSPSLLPSMMPSISTAPTGSHQPSDSPTGSSSPTLSSSPSAQPSLSAAPTGLPSSTPSVSVAPSISASPTSSPTAMPSGSPTAPTVSPTVEPTKEPTGSPSKDPTDSPTTKPPTVPGTPTETAPETPTGEILPGQPTQINPGSPTLSFPPTVEGERNASPDSFVGSPSSSGAVGLSVWGTDTTAIATTATYLMGVGGALWLFMW